MDVRYVRDVPLPGRGEWKSESTFDPLHPEHGPLPNLQGLLEYDGVQYTVAVWDAGRSMLSFLEMAKEEDSSPGTPLLPIEEVHKTRGWIALTLRWTLERGCFNCEGEQAIVPEYPGLKEEAEWEREIWRRVAMGAVRVAAKLPPGIPLATLRKLARLARS